MQTGSPGKGWARSQGDPRAGAPCRTVCLTFSIYTALCLLMPWVVLYSREPRSQGVGATDPEGLFLYPSGILGLPDILAYLGQGAPVALVVFVLASVACAAAFVLVVVGVVRIARFRGGVGQLRLGLGIVAVTVVLGGTLVMVLQAGAGGMLYPTAWGEYGFVCAAVASIAAARYDRLAGPDVDAADARLRNEGYELDGRHAYGEDAGGGDPDAVWYERSELAVRRARPGRAVSVMRTIACACGALWVVATLPALVGLCVETYAAAEVSGTSLRFMVAAVTLSPRVVLWLTAVAFVVQGIVAFARHGCGTGCLRAGALIALLCGAVTSASLALPLQAVVPGLSGETATLVTLWWGVAVLVVALLAAFLSGLADGIAFVRASRAAEE